MGSLYDTDSLIPAMLFTENFRMQIGWESGLYRYWAKKYLPKIHKCLMDHYQEDSPKVRKLCLHDLSSPLVLLLLGVSLSLLVFLLEIIWHRFKTRRLIFNSKPKENAKLPSQHPAVVPI